MRRIVVAAVVLWGVSGSGWCAEPQFITRDPALLEIVPREALEGTGCWRAGDRLVATGHSTEVTVFDDAKGRRTEREWAEDDARRRMLVFVAAAADQQFDEDAYEVTGEVTGFQAAAVFRIPGRSGVFLAGVAPADSVKAEARFSLARCRSAGISDFKEGRFAQASRRLARCTQQGAQDAETVAHAGAAAWHVNLEAGATGEARQRALEGLGGFYLDRGAWEQSLTHYHMLYKETRVPSADLLATLAQLSDRTGRPNSAKQFREEALRRYGKTVATQGGGKSRPAAAALRDARFTEPFGEVLAVEPYLLSNPGARIIEYLGRRYFVAVGMTDCRGDGAGELLRQRRVAAVQAQKEAVAFAEASSVEAVDRLQVRTTISQQGTTKSAASVRSLDESIRVKVKGMARDLQQVGTWHSPDRRSFFCAVGKEIP